MKLTRYQKYLARIVAEKYGDLPADRLVEELCRVGVVDHTLCKVLAVRGRVEELVKSGRHGKVEAMWIAAEQFCATYEYVRKCMYYYTDVNI
jgi:ribosomal protein L17